MAQVRDKQYLERTRDRIAATKILDRLIAFAEGTELDGQRIVLNEDEIRVGLRLVDKVLPSLKAVSVKVDVQVKDNRQLTRDELLQRLHALRAPDRADTVTVPAGDIENA